MIYADYNATTPMLPEALRLFAQIEEQNWGNPSSVYTHGRRARAAIEEARDSFARLLGAKPHMVLFTSGGSESNNWVLKAGSSLERRDAGRRLAVSSVEHPSVLKPAHRLAEDGGEVHFIGVDRQGRLDMQQLQTALQKKLSLVSIMAANNETGVVFPIRQIAALVHEYGALLHCDASQAVGKIPLHFLDDGIDFMTVSSHKFYGPKAVGALFVRDRRNLDKIHFGGGQEFGMRPGTENVALVCAMVKALECLQQEPYVSRLAGLSKLRDYFERRLLAECLPVSINGDAQCRLPNTSNVCFTDIDGQGLLMNLDLQECACSAGSACHSGSVEPSHVLQAMGISEPQAAASLRFSFGLQSSIVEVDQLVACLKEVLPHMRAAAPAAQVR